MGKPTVSMVLWMVFAWMMSPPITAEEAKKTPASLVEMSLNPSRIDWHSTDPAVKVQRWVLTLSGPDELFLRREFKAGKAPFLSLFDSEGDRLPDGSYTWELKVVSKDPASPRRQSGSFSIQDGSFFEAPQGTGGDAPKPPLVPTIAEDLVETGNLVVQRNACIGDKCSTTDATYSALKLKAVQPNILFDDIALPGGGPTASHDWAIFINPNDVDQFSIVDFSNALFPFSMAAGAPDNSLFIAGDGNVGLGTSTPLGRLDVRANADSQAAARIQNSSATGFSGLNYADNTGNIDLFFGIDNANSTTRLNSVNNNPIVLVTNDIERMRVTSTGYVGIGTTLPLAKLDIVANDASKAVGRITNYSATGFPGIEYLDEAGVTGFYVGLDNAANTARLNSINGYPIAILTESTERMRFTSTGNIGIGTSSPSSKLHVNGGDIRVSGGSFIDDGVTLNAPDYVFEPSYKLMPLEELRNFITQEKHLPNVPNAKEVKEQGLNLSQFQMRLLEKVEELTLYTLAQDKRFTSQQEEMLRLKEQNAVLQERLAALEKALSSEEKP